MRILFLLIAGAAVVCAQTPTKDAGRKFVGTLDATTATRTAPVKIGTAAPATCVVGDLFYDTDAAPGQNLFGCTAAPGTWTLLGGLGNVASVDGRTGTITLGDLYAAISHTHAQAEITGLVAALAAKADQSALDTHAAANGTAVHGLGSAATKAAVVSVGSPGSDSNVPTEKAVRDAIAGSTAGVSTFNARSGSVLPASGDYAATQITNTPAGNIAAITVQAALDELDSEKAAAGHNHSGTYEPANVNIQSHISNTANPHSVTKAQLGLGNVPNVDATNADNIASGTLPAGRMPAFTGDATTSAGSTAVSVARIGGVSYGLTPSLHAVPVVTGTNATTYKVVPDCKGVFNHLVFDNTTDEFACTSMPAAGPITDGYLSQADYLSFAGKQAGDADLTTIAGLAKTDDSMMIANGTDWQLKGIPLCTGAGKALTYDTATNEVGCNTLTAHTQNTDTGTTAPSFQIDSGNSGPRWKNESGTMSARNAADNDYAPVKAKTLTAGDGTASAAIELPELAANGSNKQTIYGADSQASDGCTIWPTGESSSGHTLIDQGTTATTTDGKTCRVFAWAAPTGGVSDGDKGDVTVADSGATFTVDSGAITAAKMAADIDFSAKTTTKPMKTGTSAPANCAVGEMFFDTDATVGQNIYACTAADTWTLQGDGGGAGSGVNVQDEGGASTAATTLNCVGAGISCSVSGGTATVTVAGGSASPVMSTAGQGGMFIFPWQGGTSGNGMYPIAANNKVGVWEWTLLVPITWRSAVYEVSSWVSAGDARWAVFARDGNSVLAKSAVDTSVPGTGVRSVGTWTGASCSGGACTLQPGVYLLVYSSTNGDIRLRYVDTDSLALAFIQKNATRIADAANSSSGTGASFDFPATLGTLTSTNTSRQRPAVWLEP